eukprot:3615615-Pyramimonas_sp.AAC.1
MLHGPIAHTVLVHEVFCLSCRSCDVSIRPAVPRQCSHATLFSFSLSALGVVDGTALLRVGVVLELGVLAL